MDLYDKTPLHLAVERDDSTCVEQLLTAGAELEARTAWGATPLDWAGVLGCRRAAEVLLAHGATLTLAAAAGLGRRDDVDRLEGDVNAAFALACRNGHTAVARALRDRGADVDARGYFDAPALHWAAINGHADTVRYLLGEGADSAIRDREFDADALGWASEGGHEAVLVLLRADRP